MFDIIPSGRYVLSVKNPEETRQIILQAAFEEIHRYGFQAASLNSILEKTNLTKGALFHHFSSKQELGYAVVDTILLEQAISSLCKPLQDAEDPVEFLQNYLRDKIGRLKKNSKTLECGCPINNLAQEMSPLDEGFRVRIEKIYQTWRDSIAQALEKGKSAGLVKRDVDSRGVAIFFIACFQGLIGTMKNARDITLLEQCDGTMRQFLETLRA
jgi:AcrR family transcriptional regulator